MSLKYEPASVTTTRLRISSSASLGLTDYSQVDMRGVRYNSVNYGAGKSEGSPNW